VTPWPIPPETLRKDTQTMTVATPAFPGFLRWPVRWRLSLVICLLLLASVTAFGWAAHREVEKALLDLARARLQNVSRQLTTLITQSSQQRLEEGRRLAALPAVHALIAAPDDAAAREHAKTDLEAFLKTSPQTIGLDVWGPTGVHLLGIERTSPAPARGTPPSRTTPPSATGYSALHAFHDLAYYELTVAIPRAAAPPGSPATTAPPAAPASAPAPASPADARGYLVLRRQSTTANTGATIGGLVGSGMTFEFGSKDGAWTDLSKVVAPPPTLDTTTTIEYRTADGEERLGIAATARDMPWVLWVTISRSVALAPADIFLRRIIPLSLLVVGLGSLIAFVAARRLTQPLAELTAAAESIAAGDLARRVHVRQQDEIGRLGDAFNTMAGHVEESHQRLDARVRERTHEVEQTMAALRSTQEELVRREKLAMLGQLASGVGHELRNPLGVMTNAVYFLEMVQPDASAIVKEYHGLLRAQIGLSEKIVSDLLDFARIKPPRRETLPLARLIDAQLTRVSVPENIRVVRDLAEDLPPVHVDAIQLGQVVFNLLVNALQAMEERGGVLTVRGSLQAGRVQLDVIDTGPGVQPELREKIFEALFTTKARGIGLGLAVSRSLADVNGSSLSLTSHPGEGATFTLSMPAASVLEPA
jgi:signal transduction histidine kinase